MQEEKDCYLKKAVEFAASLAVSLKILMLFTFTV